MLLVLILPDEKFGKNTTITKKAIMIAYKATKTIVL